MTSFKDAFPGRYLNAESITNPKAVEIDSIDLEEVFHKRMLVARFVGLDQGLVLDLTNSKAIAAMAGTDDYTKWPGSVVELYQTTTEFKGKRVPCLRIRRKSPSTPDLEIQTGPRM
jgi:hypothetical protein